jgi:hypothetical protein
MKNAGKREAGVSFVRIIIVAAIIGLFIFIAFYHYYYVKHDFARNSHPILSLLLACLGLWLTSMIWLSIANLLVLLIASPFLILPSLRPAAIRASTIGVMALLCARLIIFYVGLPVNSHRPMEPRPDGHFQSHFQARLGGRHHRPVAVHPSLGA